MKKTIIAIVVTIAIPLTALAISFEVNFPDVEEGTWYYSDVVKVAKDGLMTGYEDGTFGPSDYVTRAQLAAVLSRYDTDMSKNVTMLSELLCYNNTNFLDSLSENLSDTEKYTEALDYICNNSGLLGSMSFDLNTGAAEELPVPE